MELEKIELEREILELHLLGELKLWKPNWYIRARFLQLDKILEEEKKEIQKSKRESVRFVNSLSILLLLFITSCSSASVTWRNAYLSRKPIAVFKEVPLYSEHLAYLDREVKYMCLSGIKPMLPKEFTNVQALGFCGCMGDIFYTKEEWNSGLISIDFNPNELVLMIKKTQDEFWAVLDDKFRNDYREIAKYPSGFYEKITENSTNCIDDVNYTSYNKK